MDASTVDRKLLNVLASTRDTAEDVDGSDKLMGPGALVCVSVVNERSAPSLGDFAASKTYFQRNAAHRRSGQIPGRRPVGPIQVYLQG